MARGDHACGLWPRCVAEAAAEQPVRRHAPMTWMQRLKPVFAIEIERCWRCGEKLLCVASIEEPALIERILAHLKQRPEAEPRSLPFAALALLT